MTCRSDPWLLANNSRSRIDAMGRPRWSGDVLAAAAFPSTTAVMLCPANDAMCHDEWPGRALLERWANWMRHDPVVAVETQRENLRRLKAPTSIAAKGISFNLLYGARRFVRRLNELGIAHRDDLNRTLTTDHGQV